MQQIEHYSTFAAGSTMLSQRLGPQPVIHDPCLIARSELGAYTELGANTVMVETQFGDYSYTAGDNQIIYATVGKFANIASHVRINPGNHPMERVTLHHVTYRREMYGFGDDDDAFFDWRRAHHCVIGHDTWLGHNVIVMPGVRIGDGAVVGSGAVVTKDVEPYTIAVGVPARPLRRRFPQAICDALQRIAWWNWDHDTLGARLDEMNDAARFVEKYG